MAVTLKMIAKEAGVSIMAVSGVLNKRGNSKVSAATRSRILEIARKLDYHPDSLASATRTGVVRTIGVITNRDDYSSMKIASEVLCGIQSKCSELGYNVHLFDTADIPATFARIVSHKINKLVLICIQEEIRKEVAKLCREKSISLVFANGPGAFGFPGVIQNNRKAMYDCVRHLTALGHKKIGLLCSPHHIFINAQRHLGYEDALKDAGITPDPSWCSCGSYPDDKGILRLLEKIRKKELTAVATISSLWAADLLRMALKAGLSIPKDLSIVTMSTFHEAKLSLVPFSYSNYDPLALGMQCGTLLFSEEALFDEKKKVTYFCEGVFTPLESTAPPLCKTKSSSHKTTNKRSSK